MSAEAKNGEGLDWRLPARLRRIAQVFGDALNIEAADRIEELEREVERYRKGMENWKATAEQKDVQLASMAEAINTMNQIDPIRGWAKCAPPQWHDANGMQAQWHHNRPELFVRLDGQWWFCLLPRPDEAPLSEIGESELHYIAGFKPSAPDAYTEEMRSAYRNGFATCRDIVLHYLVGKVRRSGKTS